MPGRDMVQHWEIKQINKQAVVLEGFICHFKEITHYRQEYGHSMLVNKRPAGSKE